MSILADSAEFGSLSDPFSQRPPSEDRGKMSSPALCSWPSPGPVSHAEGVIAHLHAKLHLLTSGHCPVGREGKSNSGGGEGGSQTSQGEVASGQGRLLVCDGFHYLFELRWGGCFSGIFGDLILEPLSTKECDKMPVRGRGGDFLGCLCTPFADRWGSRG